MSRVHAVTTLAAVGVHLLLAVPLLKHFWGRDHHSPALAMEIPIEVAEPEQKPTRAGRRHRSARRAPEPVPVPAQPAPVPVRPPTPLRPAADAAPSPQKSDAPTPPPGSRAPAAQTTRATSSEPSALVAIARSGAMGKDANVLLMIHSAALRETSFGKELNKLLRERRLLSPLFATNDLDPLRDFDHVLLARSEADQDRTASAALQYNVPRYRVRVAPASLSDSGFALPAPQILVVAKAAAEAAAHLPHNFRLPESTGDEALALYVKAPTVVSLPTLPTLPPSLAWLTLTLSDDGSGTVTFGGADGTDGATTEPAIGHAHVAKSELRPTVEALLDAAQ